MNSIAECHYRKYGNLEVEKRYITEDGYSLGAWLANQRVAYNGTARKELIEMQKRRLDGIGFIVDVRKSKCKL